MNSSDNHDLEREVRERIASLMQSIGKAPRRRVSDEELQKLKGAAARLDQLLLYAADLNQQALKTAVGRLDQLLADIRTGKDVTQGLKSRRDQQNRE